MNGIVLLEKGEGRKLLIRKCRAIGLPVEALERLVMAEMEQAGKRRKDGINDAFDDILSSLTDEQAGG